MSSERIHIPLKCKCGALQGFADVPASHKGGRFVCRCDDCQAYAHYLGSAQDVLDKNGGTDILPIAPANIKITQGLQNLKCCRLTDKGMYRWYAGCCQTPIGNTPASTKSIYVGVCSPIINYSKDNNLRDSELGPKSLTMSFPVILRILRFMLGAYLKRQHKPSPFIDPSTGQLRVEPYILTSAEREALRPLSLI
jgi:hypothetical protein